MQHDWEPYIGRVNDKLASILVDLGLRLEIPDSTRPWLLWVWLKLKSPRPDGLSDWSEFELLSAIEDRLTQSLSQKCNAILSGSITTLGRREFYYYGANPELLESVVNDTKKTFREYEFEWGSQEDSNWRQYNEVLLPSDEQTECIQNRKVLEVLKKNGDTLTTPRDFSHWAYFKVPGDRERFKDEIQALGYGIVSQSENPEDEFVHGICFVRCQLVSQSEIDNAVLELSRIARKFDGSYDGWETQVVDT